MAVLARVGGWLLAAAIWAALKNREGVGEDFGSGGDPDEDGDRVEENGGGEEWMDGT